MRLLALSILLTACATEPHEGDIVGPFTGETRRFVIDEIRLPMNSTETREWAGDLDGDNARDNQLGQVIATLAGQDNVTMHGADMIAAGAIASTILIQADDFESDPTVGVRYLGADDAPSVIMGGSLEDGAFYSNRASVTRAPGEALVYLPVFRDADPAVVPLVRMEIDLVADGQGGFDGIVRGAVPHVVIMQAAHAGVAQMIANDPGDHPLFLSLLDLPPRDYVVSYDEFAANALMKSLLTPDLEGDEHLSFAFKIHLSPCESGRCAAAPADTCHDRVLDGDETDVDCGGSCRPCIGGATCAQASDCETGACDGGVCAAPSCGNGLLDGFETDVDCGALCSAGCANGKRCFEKTDCASGRCSNCTSSSCVKTSYGTCY